MMQRKRILHFTHIQNLAAIIASGRILCKNQLAEAGTHYDDIALKDIQLRRSRKRVPCGPLGTLPDYVPFFFAPRSPMLYYIWKNVDKYPEGQEPLVYLVSHVQSVAAAGVPFVFTDGHPIMRYISFYNDLADLDKVDWEVMQAKMWNDDEDHPDRQSKREAEFLVHHALPWELVAGLVVINDNMLERVEQLLETTDHRPPVRIIPDWYFP